MTMRTPIRDAAVAAILIAALCFTFAIATGCKPGSGSASGTGTPTLVIVTQPAGAQPGVAFTTQPVVHVRNEFGAVDTTDNTTVVQVAIMSGTGTSGAALAGTTSVTAVAGVVTFTNLSIDLAGSGYRLEFSAATFANVVSNTFTNSNSPSSTPLAYSPPWATIAPLNTINHPYNGGQTAQQNGAALATAMNALNPGDKLVIAAGTYSINMWYNLNVQGTATNPIWICAAPGATVIITRPDAAQNVINVGNGGGITRYLAFMDIEVTGGSTVMKLYDVQNMWIDNCYIHDGGGVGIAANSVDTSYLYITSNHLHTFGGHGEGMYLGSNRPSPPAPHPVMSNSVVALNHVHDCYGSGPSAQGDGIEVKQDSWGNWIVENHIHDTNYPCLTVYGTSGQAVNVIERNTLYNSNDNTMQVQGEAIVRNNLIMSCNGSAFYSRDHQDSTVNLTVVHNTIINSGRACDLRDWDGRAGMVFANNVAYSNTSDAVRFFSGSTGVSIAGNVTVGNIVGFSSGYTTGNGLSDFVNVAWNATARDARPSTGSALIGAGNVTYAVTDDITGATRSGSLESGCYDD